MNKEEFIDLKNTPITFRMVAASDIKGSDRTLAYGYTCDRYTWHAYLQSDLIHVLVYSESIGKPDRIIEYAGHNRWTPKDLIPDKRIYPESMDKEFAYILLDRGVDVPYTTFDVDRYQRVKNLRFHGAILDTNGSLAMLRN
jgi:hypothetical protein